MTAEGRISAIGYVSMRSRDLHGSIANAVDVFGLSETESNASKAFLTAQDRHHELVYTKADEDALDHIGLFVSNTDELDAVRAKVDRGGYPIVSEQPIEEHIEQGFAFVGPEGFTWQVYTEPQEYSIRKAGSGAPDRLGHANIQVTNPVLQRDFFREVFDFKVSDAIGADNFFMRCNNDHHTMAIFKANAVRLGADVFGQDPGVECRGIGSPVDVAAFGGVAR